MLFSVLIEVALDVSLDCIFGSSNFIPFDFARNALKRESLSVSDLPFCAKITVLNAKIRVKKKAFFIVGTIIERKYKKVDFVYQG